MCACLFVQVHVNTCEKYEPSVRAGVRPPEGSRHRGAAPFPEVFLSPVPSSFPFPCPVPNNFPFPCNAAGRLSAEATCLFNTMRKLVKFWVSRSHIAVKKNMQCFSHLCPDTSSLSKGANPLKKKSKHTKTKTFLQLEKYQHKFFKLLQMFWEDFHIASLTENSRDNAGKAEGCLTVV